MMEGTKRRIEGRGRKENEGEAREVGRMERMSWWWKVVMTWTMTWMMTWRWNEQHVVHMKTPWVTDAQTPLSWPKKKGGGIPGREEGKTEGREERQKEGKEGGRKEELQKEGKRGAGMKE